MAVDLSRLLAALNQSKLQQENNSAYQTIKGLIDAVKNIQGEVTANASSSSGGGGGSTPVVVDALPLTMLIAKGQSGVPLPGGTSTSDPFVGSMFLGGM